MSERTIEDIDWYQEAWIYDLAFDYSPANDLRLLYSALQEFGGSDSRAVLEPMIGTGRLGAGICDRGFDLFGYDLSRPMLLRASAREPRAALFQARAGSVPLPAQFGFAHCLIDSFRYLTERPLASTFLRQTLRALKPGGLFVLGLELAGDRLPEREDWTVQKGNDPIRVAVYDEAGPSPELRWLISEVHLPEALGGAHYRSRRLQRLWRGEDFLTLAAEQSEAELLGLWLRTHDLNSPLLELPRAGGPVIAIFRAHQTP